MNNTQSIFIIIILTIVIIFPTTQAFASNIEIIEHNVELKNFVNNRYYSTWIIDVKEFSTVAVNIKSENLSGLTIGIILYDKFIQWDPLQHTSAPDLQSMAIAFERNSGSISYNSRIDSKYVVMVTHDTKISLDEIKISYIKKEMEISETIPIEVWIALLGIGGGAAIGIPMQQYYKNQRKNDLKTSLKKDLAEIRDIMKNVVKEETDNIYIKTDEVAKITLRVYDENRVEASILLDWDTHKAVRDAYEKIKKTIMNYAEFVDDTRRFKKNDQKTLLEFADKALAKLK